MAEHQLHGHPRGGATLGTACRQVTAQLLRKHGVQPSEQSAVEAAGAGESSGSSGSDDEMEGGSGHGEEDCAAGGHIIGTAEAAEQSQSGDDEGSEDESDDGEVDAVSGGEAAAQPGTSASLAPAAAGPQEAGRVPLPAPAPSRPVRSSLAWQPPMSGPCRCLTLPRLAIAQDPAAASPWLCGRADGRMCLLFRFLNVCQTAADACWRAVEAAGAVGPTGRVVLAGDAEDVRGVRGDGERALGGGPSAHSVPHPRRQHRLAGR